VLCVGDLHVPYRAERTPAEFKPGLQAGKMQHAVCTGNVGAKEELDLLKEAAPNYVQARGDFDVRAARAGGGLGGARGARGGGWVGVTLHARCCSYSPAGGAR
jgi:predicted phosphodiesterase